MRKFIVLQFVTLGGVIIANYERTGEVKTDSF